MVSTSSLTPLVIAGSIILAFVWPALQTPPPNIRFPPFSMQAMICSPHYYRHQIEVKEDLSDIWKEEDPDYKFLNYTRKKAWEGRGMNWPSAGSHIFLMMFCLVAWKRVPLTGRPMTVAERRHERPQQKLQFTNTSSCLFTRSFPGCNQGNFQLRSSSFYLSKKNPPLPP